MLKKIREIAEENGMEIFGTGYIADKLDSSLSCFTHAITIGIRYPRYIIDQIKNGPTPTYFHQYRTMNSNLDRCSMLIQSYVLKNNHEALYIPASQSNPKSKFDALFSHKTAAVRAGLGFVGKNNLFISKDFGSAIRLSTILTNSTLPEAKEIENKCGNCNICKIACPSGAIYGIVSSEYDRNEVFSSEKCSHHMKQKYMHIGRGVVCGICIGVCPYSIKGF